MIVPMKKTAVVVREGDRQAALERLRALGVMHLEIGQVSSEALSGLLERRRILEAASNILKSQKAPAGAALLSGAMDAEEGARTAVALVEERRNLLDEQGRMAKEIERLLPWGEFDPEDILFLRSHGVPLRLFEFPAKMESRLPEDIGRLGLRRVGKLVRTAMLMTEDQSLPEGFEELPLPPTGIEGMRKKAEEIRSHIEGIGKELASLAPTRKAMEDRKTALARDIEFETARAGMNAAEGNLAWISGFIPAGESKGFLAEAAKEGWAALVRDPEPGEAIPTLVENNRVVRLIQPVLEALAVVPGYKEYEISLWFLIFFTVFFGMIIGDAAYGLIMLAVSGWLSVRRKRAGERVPDMLRLMIVLSCSTVAWGAVTGTWFSIDPSVLPSPFRALILPILDPSKTDAKLVQQNIMQFCFLLGSVQLCIAHLKNIRRDFPGLKFIAQIGWLMMVVGLYFLVMYMVVDKTRFPIPTWSIVLILVGFVLYFVFGNQEGNFLKGLLASCINFIPTFLGAVSCFADIISYIRLFAVGLAGAAISQTVNGMVLSMPAGVVRIAGGTLLLCFGHSLNLALSILSVVVHGIRLNMLEFSNHLGMEWSGTAYKPFAMQSKR